MKKRAVKDLSLSLLDLVASLSDSQLAAMTINVLSHYGGLQLPMVSDTMTPKVVKTIDEAIGDNGKLSWPPWSTQEMEDCWAAFVEYRKTEHRARYASVKTEQRALNLALRYFTTPEAFCSGLEYTMARQWVFPVDPAQHQYPKPQTTKYELPKGLTAPPMFTNDPGAGE